MIDLTRKFVNSITFYWSIRKMCLIYQNAHNKVNYPVTSPSCPFGHNYSTALWEVKEIIKINLITENIWWLNFCLKHFLFKGRYLLIILA